MPARKKNKEGKEVIEKGKGNQNIWVVKIGGIGLKQPVGMLTKMGKEKNDQGRAEGVFFLHSTNLAMMDMYIAKRNNLLKLLLTYSKQTKILSYRHWQTC